MPSHRVRVARTIGFSVMAALSLGCSAPSSPPTPPAPLIDLPAGLDTVVEKVVDGDTLMVSGGHLVRLIGIDAPETHHPRRPVECFGPEASAFLGRELSAGTGVRLVGDEEQRDFYDRTLAYVFRLPDGVFMNAELVRQGYARVLTIAPNLAHSDELVALEQDARAGARGLWQACETSS